MIINSSNHLSKYQGGSKDNDAKLSGIDLILAYNYREEKNNYSLQCSHGDQV